MSWQSKSISPLPFTHHSHDFSPCPQPLFRPLLPLPSSSPSQPPPPAATTTTSSQPSSSSGPPLNTLDEPIRATFARDLKRVGANLVLVAAPFGGRARDAQTAALRNWDLWGPMTFALLLAVALSAGSPKPGAVFSLVFGLCAGGAVVLTANVVLLGGNIGFFQSLCLLGYCLFPLDVAAFVAGAVPLVAVKWAAVAVGLAWASWAAVPFVGGSVPPARRALAVYPLFLLYATMGWLALVKG